MSDEPLTGRSALTQRVRDAVSRAARRPVEEVHPDSGLRQLGVDSLAAIQLLYELEDKLGIVLPDERLATLETVADVTDLVVEIIAASVPEPAPGGSEPSS